MKAYEPILVEKDIIIKRLRIIKLLYKQGVQQSYMTDTVSCFSILSFHDSVEMFINLCAENHGLNPAKWSFLQYWDNINDLTMKEAMRRLNDRRRNLKHKGLIPGKIEIEASRVATTEFFNENSFKQFNIKFNDISLIELLDDSDIKDYLLQAVKQFELGNLPESIESVKEAFYKLIDSYKESKGSMLIRTPMDFIEVTEYRVSEIHEKTSTDSRLENIFRIVNRNFKNIEDALTITSLGLDYKKYMKFKALTPYGLKTHSGDYIFEKPTNKNWNKENFEFCIEYVIECGLKLQEFDFNYDSLVTG